MFKIPCIFIPEYWYFTETQILAYIITVQLTKSEQLEGIYYLTANTQILLF